MTGPRSFPARVVLIGPECTGKTRLALDLAKHYSAPVSEEFARVFVERHRRSVFFCDVDSIGRGQLELEDAALANAAAAGSPLVFHDTDLVSTLVYSRHYFADCPAWIEPAARNRLSELYLLHDIDVPWAADGNQRDQPERREALMEMFRTTLAAFEARVVLIAGPWPARQRLAELAIDNLRLQRRT